MRTGLYITTSFRISLKFVKYEGIRGNQKGQPKPYDTGKLHEQHYEDNVYRARQFPTERSYTILDNGCGIAMLGRD